MQIITNWWGVNHLLFEWHFVFWTHPTFQAQNRKWKFWPQFRIFIPYLMKSATSIKVSYINEIDMSSSIHKMNAINILPIYTPQITSQTPGSPFISKFWPGLSFETIPCHLRLSSDQPEFPLFLNSTLTVTMLCQLTRKIELIINI